MGEDGGMATNPLSGRVNTQGAVDLGALAAARENQAKAERALADAPEGVVRTVTMENFEADVVNLSMTVPVVVNLHSDRSPASAQLTPILEQLAAEFRGQFVLALVNVDTDAQIAQAFQVQAIPTVIAVLKGQPVPLFEGAQPEPQIREVLAEVLRVAAENGITGELDGEQSPVAEPAEEPIDPRFEAAYDAIEAGDWDAAERAYRTVLDSTPADTDAQAGLAMVGLYKRTDGKEFPADPQGIDDSMLAADFAALEGDWPGAFALLVDCVRRTAGDERDAARARLIELFLVAGDDPAVAPARTALASALY
jgi:putative thioredoxin